jgi:hypothetical protein
MSDGWGAAEFMAADDELTPMGKALALSAMRDAADDAAERRAEEERAAAAETHAESLAFGNRQAGNPYGNLSLARNRLAAADDETRDLEAQLAKVRQRRDRAQAAVEYWAQRAAQLHQAVSRSAVPSDPVERAARHAHDVFRELTRQKFADATAGRPSGARRPFASRGGATGPEPACAECRAAGATVDESFLIHNDPHPEPVPDDWEPAQAEADRLIRAGYTRETARLAAREIAR